MRAFYRLLPHSCLLTLHDGDGAGRPLVEALHQAFCTGQRSVWVDCRHVSVLPGEALLLLSQCAARLWKHGGYLVMCHLPARVRAGLIPNPLQPLAASLLDAEQYGLGFPGDTV